MEPEHIVEGKREVEDSIFEPEFQHLVEGWGETQDPIQESCILVWVTSPEILNLDQGSVVKPIVLEVTCHASFQWVPPDFGILQYYWNILEDIANTISTIEFPISNAQGNAPMKLISLLNLPNFHGITTVYPYSFLFKFDVSCQICDYTDDL